MFKLPEIRKLCCEFLTNLEPGVLTSVWLGSFALISSHQLLLLQDVKFGREIVVSEAD